MNTHLKEKAVLVVDDEESVLNSLRRLLRGEEYQLFLANSAWDARKIVEERDVDVILCDFNMPGENGLDFLKDIHSQKPEIANIMLTAYTTPSLLVEAINNSVLFRFFEKPWVGEEIKQAIVEGIHYSQIQRAAVENFSRQEEEIKRLISESEHDGLTGCYNRKTAMKKLDEQLGNSQRYDTTFSAVMLDIDLFKKVNDSYGHQQGDLVLKGVVKIVEESLRTPDILGRYGGEEFIIILPFTESESALVAMDRVRQKISEIYWDMSELQVTVSMGISQWCSSDTSKSLVKRADDALYRAKSGGRNRIVVG
jgi:two-component system, cell cycle response regulator